MTFAHPYVLLLLLVLPVLAWLKGKQGHYSAFVYSSVSLVKPFSGLTRSRAGSVLAALRWFALGDSDEGGGASSQSGFNLMDGFPWSCRKDGVAAWEVFRWAWDQSCLGFGDTPNG